MKECILVLSYLSVAAIVGVTLVVIMRRCRPARLLAEEEYWLVAALALVWPAVLAGALVGLAGITAIKGFSVVIRLALRAIDAVALKMRRGNK